MKQMIVKIGYIGSKHSVQKAEQLATSIPEINLRTYIYENPYEVARLHKQAIVETDVICFSGIVSYYYRDRTVSTNKPYVITPFHEYMIVASILACMLKYSVQINEISLDLPDRQLLQEVEMNIGEKIDPNFVYDYRWIYDEAITRELSFTEMATFHKQLYKEGKTKVAITSIHHVYDELIRNHIPAIYMVDHNRNTKNILEEAKKSVLYTRLEDGMIAAVYLSLKNSDSFHDSEIEMITSSIQTNIKLMNKDLENKSKLAFYTTRGIVENWLLKNEHVNWVKNIEQKLGKTLNIGIGYGRHFFEAEENAEQAIQSAKSKDQSNAYIITEQKKQIGPMFGKTKQDAIRIYDDWLRELTDRTKTNMNTMKRFMNFMEINEYQPFTVHELASYSNVTVRTSERFIKRLYESGIVVIYGMEQNQMKGRPRSVYVLNEKVEHKFRHMNQKLG